MRRTDLALRALKRLDVVDDGLQAADLARDLDSTRQFIPQVLAPLVRAGWVISVPGPRGGYRLVADLDKCSLLDVIEIMEQLETLGASAILETRITNCRL